MFETVTPILRLIDVRRVFQLGEVHVPVLRGIDLTIHAGSLTVLLGPSGSGKTTLLNLFGGIDSPTSGEVRFHGRDLAALTERELTRYRRENVGFVFQFYNLVPTLTALENVMVGAELVDDPADPRELLDLVELGDRVDHFPAQLSGGEQQRVAIARALAKNPTLLLCDEPTGALDLETGRSVLGTLRDACRRLHTTVIIVTHNSAIAALADRVISLSSGHVESVRDNDHAADPQEIVW